MNILYFIAMNDRSSLANPYTRELAAGASQNIFAGELQSGAFSYDLKHLIRTVETSLTIPSG